MDNKCVCCNTIIPEGRQVCPNCENGSEIIQNKKKYIRDCFRNYLNNKKQLESLLMPGTGGVDYSRPSCVVGGLSENGVENGVLKYIDKKSELSKKVEIVKKTIGHFKIEDKRSGSQSKLKYIYARFLQKMTYRRASIECYISERTAMYWEEDIYYTAECIAEEYDLF